MGREKIQNISRLLQNEKQAMPAASVIDPDIINSLKFFVLANKLPIIGRNTRQAALCTLIYKVNSPREIPIDSLTGSM